jgi:hypothetical protein
MRMSFSNRFSNKPFIELQTNQNIVLEGAIIDFRIRIDNSLFQFCFINGHFKFIHRNTLLSLSVYEAVEIKIVALNIFNCVSLIHNTVPTASCLDKKLFTWKRFNQKISADSSIVKSKPNNGRWDVYLKKSFNSIKLKQLKNEPRLL